MADSEKDKRTEYPFAKTGITTGQIVGMLTVAQVLNVGAVAGRGLGDVNLSGGLNVGTATGAAAGGLSLSGSILLNNGQYLQMKRSTGSATVNVLGIGAATDVLNMVVPHSTAGAAFTINNYGGSNLVTLTGAGSLTVAGGLNVGTATGATPGQIKTSDDIIIADGKNLEWSDTNLYRSAANMLTTDDGLTVAGGLNVGTAASAGTGDGFFSGGLKVLGATTEAALSADSIRIGVVSGTPRVVLEDAASATLWEIDNSAGVLRFFNPGAIRADLDGSGNFRAYAKVRADTVFNCNNVDGVSDAGAGVPTALTATGGLVTAVTKTAGATNTAAGTPATMSVSGGVVTAITKVTPIADGSYSIYNEAVSGKVNTITVTNGHITGIAVEP